MCVGCGMFVLHATVVILYSSVLCSIEILSVAPFGCSLLSRRVTIVVPYLKFILWIQTRIQKVPCKNQHMAVQARNCMPALAWHIDPQNPRTRRLARWVGMRSDDGQVNALSVERFSSSVSAWFQGRIRPIPFPLVL